MLTGSSDKTARLWDPETGECKQILEGHTDEIFSCAFNYEGNTIITGKIHCISGMELNSHTVSDLLIVILGTSLSIGILHSCKILVCSHTALTDIFPP